MSQSTNMLHNDNLFRLSLPIVATRFLVMSLPFVDGVLLGYYSVDAINMLSLSIPISQFFYLISIGLLGTSITFLKEGKINFSELIISSIILGFAIILMGGICSLFIDNNYVTPVLLCCLNAGLAVVIYTGTIIVEYNGRANKTLNMNYCAFVINLILDIYFIFYCQAFNVVVGCLLATLFVRIITTYTILRIILPVSIDMRFYRMTNLFKNSATFALNSSMFYFIIMLVVFLESTKLDKTSFAVFNMLMNITNFSFVMFIGINIAIQIFIKENAIQLKELIILIIKITFGFIFIFLLIMLVFIKISTYLNPNSIFSVIHIYKMSYECIVNIVLEGFILSFMGYLTSINKHSLQNILKLVFMYLLLLAMFIYDDYSNVFMYIAIANLLSLLFIMINIFKNSPSLFSNSM